MPQPTALPRAPPAASTHSYTAKCKQEIYFKAQPQNRGLRLLYLTHCKAGLIGFVWKNVASVVVSLFPSEFYSSISSSNHYISPAYFSLHFEARKVLGPNTICVLERSKPVVLQISRVVGQTLPLNLLHFHED